MKRLLIFGLEGLRKKTLKKLARFIEAQGEMRSEYYQLRVLHDDWCNRLRGGIECNCDPDFSLSQPQNAMNN